MEARPQLSASKTTTAPHGDASRVVVPKATRPATPGPQIASGKILEWERFIEFLVERGARILCENFKRLKPTRFEVGILEATGPEFTITSVNREKSKVQELLSQFAGEAQGAPRWNITLQKGEGVGEGAAQLDSATRKKVLIDEVESHPALQSLQKVFPGSKVERVNVKN